MFLCLLIDDQLIDPGMYFCPAVMETDPTTKLECSHVEHNTTEKSPQQDSFKKLSFRKNTHYFF